MIIISIATVFAILIALPLPLFGTPGPEAAALLGLIVGPALLIAGAQKGAQRDKAGFGRDVYALLFWLVAAFLLFVFATVVRSWFGQSCGPDRGILPFFVVSLPVLWLNLMVGVWLGRICPWRRLITVLAIAFLIGYVALQTMLWWHEPSLRFITQLLIVVTSDLLSGQPLSDPLILFRASTFLYGLVLFMVGLIVFPNIERRGLSAPAKASYAMIFVSVLVAVAAASLHGLSLKSLAPSRIEMHSVYSFEKERDGIIVHADPQLTDYRVINATLEEASLWIGRLTQRLNIKPAGDIHIWLHPDTQTAAYYTGALNVHFALPRHREVHISPSVLPHPTLGHELAHVLIGQLTDNLFGTPGSIPFLPNVALTEGLAVAVTPELKIANGLTLEEQAAAMFQAGIKTDLAKIFSPWPWHFWSESSERAYVAAGALLKHLAEQSNSPATVFQKVAREGSIKDPQIFVDAEAYLMKADLPKDAVATAKSIFAKDSIFAATCDPEHIEWQQQLAANLNQGDFAKAEKNPPKATTQQDSFFYNLANKAIEFGQLDRAEGYLAQASDPTSKQLLGDVQWVMGDKSEALLAWRSIDQDTLSPDTARQVLAKTVLAEMGANDAVDLLTNNASASINWNARFMKLAESVGQDLKKAPPLSVYILARGYFTNSDHKTALAHFDRIAPKLNELPKPFAEQSLGLMALANSHLGNQAKAIELFEERLKGETRQAAVLHHQDLIDRAKWLREHAGDQWLLGKQY